MSKKKVVKFHKLIIIQLYGYLALIPFIFALFTLIDSSNKTDIIIYTVGLLLILVLLLVNHLEPVVRVTEDKILLYNTFNNRPVVLLKRDFNSYEKINNRLIKLTFAKKVYEINLNKGELKNFIQILEGIN